MLIQLYPSKILLQKSLNVESFDEALRDTVAEMSVLMRKLKGAGLAAPQVGINKNIFIMELSEEKSDTPLENIEVVINPKILSKSEEYVIDLEGCLSFPSIFEKVKRSTYVEVEYQGLNGNVLNKRFSGRLARCFQHEYEHLQGEVFIKHISALKRDMVKRKMTKINALLGRA